MYSRVKFRHFFFTSSGLEIRLGIRGEKDGKSNFINNINLQRFGGPCFILAIHVTIQAKIPCPSSTPSYFPGLVIFVNSLKFELESLKTFPIFLFPLMFSFKLILCNRWKLVIISLWFSFCNCFILLESHLAAFIISKGEIYYYKEIPKA